MEEIGGALFSSLCVSVDDRRFRHALGVGLDGTSIEIRGMSGRVPWELLRDPETGRIPAVDAERMVRVVPGPGHEAAQVSRDARLLLVVSRPLGTQDVGFQSVARPLLRTLAATGAFEISVLRPPTHAKLRAVLAAAQQEGRPFELVHFDGHGLLQDGSGLLVFEGARRGDQAELIRGGVLGADLASAGVRIAVLNACRSADVGPSTSTQAVRSLAEEAPLSLVCRPPSRCSTTFAWTRQHGSWCRYTRDWRLDGLSATARGTPAARYTAQWLRRASVGSWQQSTIGSFLPCSWPSM